MPSHIVPNMQMIPQDQSNACWFAAAQMVVQWRRSTARQTETGLLDPEEVPAAVAVHRANDVLAWSSMRKFAQLVGLTPLPLVTPRAETLLNWLQVYGPIWTDGVPIDAHGNPVGTGHVVVLSGIRIWQNRSEIRIHDPWPPTVGDVSWRPISHLAAILSDGGNPVRNTCFLRR